MLLNIDANAFWVLALMPLLGVTCFFTLMYIVVRVVSK